MSTPRKVAKVAVTELTRVVTDAVDSADMLGYLDCHLEDVTAAARQIIDYALEQWADSMPMTTQDSIGFLQLEYAINSAVVTPSQPEGPLPWLDIVRLVLKLLYTIEKQVSLPSVCVTV